MKTSVDIGRQLHRLLPEVYRSRDNPQRDASGKVTREGDLARLLDAHGELLGRFHKTLVQLLDDHFPDEAVDETGAVRSCQPWLLPYFAQLLDVALVSPDTPGQRAEVARAVAWRKRKGTRVCVEDIAQQIGGFEVELQEGHTRVARTPRPGEPLPRATALGEPFEPDMSLLPPSRRALHPGVRVATVDLRRRSRAVQCDPTNPASHTSALDGDITWRQIEPHGAPCLPGSYQDVSPRTPDLRTPRFDRGHFHPRRVLLFTPPSDGYFSEATPTLSWSRARDPWGRDASLVRVTEDTVVWKDKEVRRVTYTGLTAQPLRVTGVVTLAEEAVFRFENLWLAHPVNVHKGKIELDGCAVRKLTVLTAGVTEPVLDARSTLFHSMYSTLGLARLEYCTVLRTLLAKVLQASDCIFLRPVRREWGGVTLPVRGCVRYSCLPEQPFMEDLLSCTGTITHEEPWFYSETFGEPGCAVLHPGAAEALRAGAEDGGELGAYHERLYCLRWSAVLEKLADYLPVGMEAVLIADPTLRCAPPEAAPR